MKNLKKILSVLTLIVLVGSDFLTSISFALDDLLEDYVVVQAENEETGSVEIEEENVDEEDSGIVHEDESIKDENGGGETVEGIIGDIVEGGTGEVSGIGSGEVGELTEETVEGATGAIEEGGTGLVEELTGTVDENTGTEEETLIEEMKYNEEPIFGEKTYSDVTVRVEALSGIFPEGTELKIEPIKGGDLSSLKDKLVEEKQEIKKDTTVVAFDITFKYEGEEVQPKDGEKVKVTFDYSRNKDLVKADKNENQEVKVYHMEDKDEEGNKVVQGEEKVVDVTNRQESAEIGIAVADADSFSVYVVTYGNEDPEFSATLVGEDSARNNFHYKTITISDGENTYTLMDRNLGARVAWNTGIYAFDDKSNYNTEDDYYGYYYQWGNNYGFSTTQKYGNVISDAIPSNYVSSTWSTSNLGGYNLRGDTTNTESARQGPCPRGWHVPSSDEWEAIRDAWCVSAEKGEDCNAGKGFAEALQMPTAGYRYYIMGSFHYDGSGSNGTYRSSTSDNDSSANFLLFTSWNIKPKYNPGSNDNTFKRTTGMPVRCLKNNTDAVTLYLNPNGGRVEDGIKDADAQGKVILPTATRNEYNFDGWYDAVDGGNRRGGSGDDITINEDTDLYAHWSEIIPNHIVTFNNGANESIVEVENGARVTAPDDPTNGDLIFAGWYTSEDNGQTLSDTVFDFNTPITTDITLYAKWISCEDGEIYSPELGECVVRWYELVSLTDDTTTTTVGSDDAVVGFPIIMTVTENTISEIDGQKLAGELNIDFGGKDAKFSHLVKVKIPVEGSSKAYVKVKHVGSTKYNFDGLTTNTGASCDDGSIVNPDDMYHGEYMNVESGYVSIYTCEASDFAAFGTPKVTFEPNNGDDPIIVEVESGATVDNGDIPIVSNSGLDFAGWYISEDDGQTLSDTVFDFGTPITGDIMLYAKWSKNKRITDQMPDFTWGEISISRPDSLSGIYQDSPATYVVMDRNLGASEPGSGESSYGYRYQFGNNYGFEGEQGDTAINRREADVNLTEYSNSNPYYSGVFVLGLSESGSTEGDWATTSNNDIWGGESLKESDRQGPCPNGWHIPTKSEWNNLIDYWTGQNGGMDIINFANELELPLPGSLSRSSGEYYGNSYGKEGYYWSTSTSSEHKKPSYVLQITSIGYNSNYSENRVNGYSVRCFKNDDAVYTITYDDGVNGEELFSDQSGTGYRGDVYPAFSGNPEWSGKDRVFLGWYKEIGGEYTQVNTETAQITSNVVLYAKWSKCGEGECIVPTEEDEIVSDEVQDLDIYFIIDDNTFNHYTIQDRNPGATSNDISSTGSYGYQYQWGNNHGFLSCGINGCGSFPGGEANPVSTLETHALDYGPGNYYSGNVFIKSSGDWANPKNDNLWGDDTDASGDNPSARQGPCDIGYHVPSSAEWLLIQNAWLGVNDGNPNKCTGSDLILKETNACAAKIRNDLLLPNVGRRDNKDGKVGMMVAASYWTSSPSGEKGDGFYYNNNETSASNSLKFASESRARARSVRCVKDVYNTPLKINIASGTRAAVSVYGGRLHYLTDPTKTGYDFRGWYSNLTGNIKIEDRGKINSGISILYAKWIGEGDIEYIFHANEGIFTSTTTDQFVQIYELSDTVNSGDIETPIRTGYNFLGWYDELGNSVNFPIVVVGNLDLYAHWEKSGGTDAIITVNYYLKNLDEENNVLTGGEREYLTGVEFTGISGDIVDILARYGTGIEGYEYSTSIVYGSDLDEYGIETGTTTVLADGSRVIDMYYVPSIYQFTLNSELHSSTVGSSESTGYYYGAKVTLSGDSNDDCYSWSGWNGLPEGTTNSAQTSFSMPNDSVTVTPSVKENTYNIIFSGNESSSGEMSRINEVRCTESIQLTPNAFGKTGYTFTGWSRTSGENTREYTNGQTVSGLSKTNLDNVTLYAVWDINKYIVTGSVAAGQENMGYLSGMGNTGINLIGLYEYGSELIFIAIPELGYVFDYWVNGNEIISGTDLGDGTNQLTVVVNQILDIIAFFKPSENTLYTVEHYKQNLDQTGYEFVWSGTMYGTTNGLTNATGTDYEGFTLSGDLASYQTGIKADGSTIVKLYYNRNTYTVTRNMWEGHLDRRKIDENVLYGKIPIFEWDDEDKYTPKRGREVDTDDIKYDFIFTGWIKSGSTEIIKNLTTQIVTGNVTYTAQYDTGYRYYEVRYHPGEGTGSMENNNLQLYISGNLNKNTFTKTGYEFSGWMRDLGEGGEIFYEDEQEVNLGIEDVDGEAERYLLFIDLYAQWKPSTGTKVTVNYYLKDLDVDNNVLIDTTTKYATGVEFTGTADSIIDSILTAYGTGINGYEYSKSIVYGSDYPSGIETGATTVLADGSRVIDMYYVPSIYQFTLNSESHSNTAGTSENTGYYFGAKLILSGDSNDDCFTWSGWTTSGITLSDNTVKRTSFTMPANDVEATPSTTENTYNIIFNGNGNTSGTMSPMNGVKCTESTGLTINTFGKTGHTFTGWSTTVGGSREYIDGATVDRLSTGADVNLYAVWDINKYDVNASVAAGDHGSLQWSGAGIYEFGETLVIIAVPELGYLLDYWEINGETELPEGATTGENQLNIVVNQILDIVAHFKENVGTVTVNYYEMDTGGTYSGVTNSTTFTGLVGYTGYANIDVPYGFHLDTERTANTGIVISDNDAENVISIYYARDKNHINISYTGDFAGEIMSFGSTVIVNPVLRERYYYGEHVYFEAIPNTGYVSKSWMYSGDRQETVTMNQREISFDMGINEVRLTLDGDVINYYIYYNLDGGIENPERPKNRTGYTVRDYSFEIYDPIKTGYIFLGWTGGINGTGISTPASGLIVNVASGVGDMSYYANWEQKPYIVNVTIEPENGGTVWGTGEYYYGDPISLIATPNVDSGYQFTGWYAGYDKISDYYSYGFQADDSGGTGLVAKFELRNHYLEVIPNDWTKGYYYPEYRSYYQYGTIVPVYASPNPGYQIRGWRWSEGEDYITTGEDNHIYTGLNLDVRIIRDTSMRLEFEPEIYNVTYMYNDEVLSLTPSTYSVENHLCSDRFEGCMQILPEYSKDGYDFTGWYRNPWISQESKVERISSIGGVTVYAGMIPTIYRVNYHLGSGETLPWWYVDSFDEYTIESGRTYLPEPEKQGYNFLGWKDSNNQIITGYGGGMTGNIDLYPIWTGKEMDIEVRYHEMDTNGQYPREWSGIYYTGLTASTFIVPDYTHTGFSQDRVNYPYQPTSIVVSGNESANVVDVYYKRETYWLDTSGIRRLLPEIDSGVTFAEVIPNKQASGNRYYFGEEITVNLLFNDGWNFTGWYDATDEGMGFPPEEVSDLTARNISFHMPAHNVKVEPLMEHILYTLSFTGYEGSDVLENYPGVEDQEVYYGYHAYLPYLNKSGYWFNGWKDEYGNYEWRTGEPYPSEPTLQRMPAHDYELIADFSPRTDMGYAEYYYLQDIEGSGYTLSGDLTTWWLDGVTEQLIPKRYLTISGFDLPRYWIDGQDLPYDSNGPVIKATGDNYINYYYDRLTYLVDVDYDDSKMSISGIGEYRYDAPVTLTAIVNTGYEFSGFVSSERPEYDTTGSTLSFRVPYDFISGYPCIISAYAKPIEYSIEYELDGGESYYSYPTGYTIEDETIYLSDPYKDGYTFLGWTGGVKGVWEITEPTTGLVITGGSIGDRKYFANFVPDKVDVTVNYYLKKIDPENNVLTGGVDIYLTGVEYTGVSDDIVNISGSYWTGIVGYHYDHATIFSGLEEVTTIETTVLSDGTREINMYYIPNQNHFSIITDAYSSTEGSSTSGMYYYGATITLSGSSINDCYSWDKWGSLPDGVQNSPYVTFSMPDENVEVESMVRENLYSIVFDANGGSGTMSSMDLIQCSDTIELSPSTFEKDGYTFTGWSTTSTGLVEYTDEDEINALSTQSGGIVTLYAVWDINWYTVIFDLSGGSLTGDMTLTKEYTIETSGISLADYIPVKTGYTFTGWYRGDNLVNSIAGGETGDYTLTAKWEANDVFLHISYLGKMLTGEYYYIMSESGDYPKVGSFYEAEIKEFSGFTYDPTEPKNITGIIVSYDEGQNDIQIYYKRDQYSVEIINDGEGISNETSGSGDYLYEEPVTVSVNALTGWEFVDWTLIEGTLSGVDLSGTTISFNMPAENIQISPNLNHIEYTVSFDAVSGTTVEESQTYYYNDNLSGLDNAVTIRTGYDFDGWYLSGVLYTSGSTMPAENITLTAKWTPRTGVQYQVNHRGENTGDNNYEVLLSGYIMYGTSDTQTIAESGNFAGFTLSGDVEQEIIDPNGTTVVDIYYNRNVYSIILDNNGGIGVTELTGKYQAPLIVPNPTKSGYEFAGWNPELPTTMPSYNYTGIAMWNPSTGEYKVEFYYQLSDGTYPSVATSGVIRTGMTEGTGSVTAADKNPTMSGYSFDSTNTGNVLEGEIVGDGSLVLKVYFKKQFTVRYLTGLYGTFSVDVHSNLDYGVGTPIFRGSTGSHESGYTFLGWNPELTGIVVEDRDYIAQWKADSDTEFKVEYYLQNVEDDGYTFAETGLQTGTTNTTGYADTMKEFTGFIFSGGNQNNITSGVIVGDGSLVLKLYYDRKEYNVTIGEVGHGTMEGGTGSQRYGKRITFTAHPNAGYMISKWLRDGTEILSGWVIWTGEELEIEVDTGMEIGVEFKAREDTSYYVEYYKENLEGGYNVWTGIYSGTTDQEAIASELIFTGFTYDSGNVDNVTTGNIDGDGSRVLKMYYNREIYTITWLNEDGTDMDTTTVKYGEIPTHADPTQPADVHYTYKFKGWDPEPTFATGEMSYRATYEYIANKHTITWKNDDGSLIDKTMVEYGTIPTHTKPTKAETEDYRYVFAGWDPEVVAVVGDAEYTAVFNAEEKEKSSKGGGMSGGGGRGGNIDNSDNQHGSAEENIDGSGYTGDEVVEVDDTNKDIVPLYKWTYENNVTTMDTLEDADPDGLLTRGHLAKMVVNYMVNVLGRSMPYDITYNCLYWGDDESSWESDEIRDYATKACAFGVMGINMENNEFLPNNIVTRAEFGTVMSRVLWGDKYDITDTNHRSYFEDHLQALKKDNILTQIANPETRWEIRKWVWLVFRRIVEKYKK